MMRAALGLVTVAVLATGCVRHVGKSRAFDPAHLDAPGWTRVTGVSDVRQQGRWDCGPAAAAVVLGRWAHLVGNAGLAAVTVPEGGLTAGQVRDLLRARGLRSFVVAGTLADLAHELGEGRPVIVGTTKPFARASVGKVKARRHFEVVVAIHRARAATSPSAIVTLDPALGWRVFSVKDFMAEWRPSGYTAVVALPPAVDSRR